MQIYLTDRSRLWSIAAALLLLILMGGQLLSVVATKSPTIDEKTKIMLGYFPLATGEWRFQVENPPLTTVFQALPLLLIPERPDPTQFEKWDDPDWQNRWPSAFFTEVVQAFPHTFAELIARARVMNILITLLVSGIIGLVVSRWFGLLAGLVTVAWLAISPNWLAHGSLANNDLLAAALYILALMLFWVALQQPNWKSLIFAGLAFGAALGTKTSLLLLVPAIGFFCFFYFLGIKDGSSKLEFERATVKSNIARILGVVAATGLLGFLTLWVIYGFDFGPWRSGWWPLPLPTYITKVLLPTFRHAGAGHTSYLKGMRSFEGWWYYFPVVFLVKTPIPTLLGAVIGGLLLVKRKKWLTFSLLVSPPILWMFASMFTRINIGYRHILPILPFLILLIATLFWESKLTRLRIGFIALLFLWLFIGTISLAPNYLSYFNEVAGGPKNGIAWASDSNLDWGQDLAELEKYLQDQEIPFIFLSYYGIPELPEQYKINYHPFPNFFDLHDPLYTPYNPPEGIFAISATHRTGQTIYPAFGEDAVDWFNHQQPCDMVSTTIYIYCVEPDPNPPQWLGICLGLEPLITKDTALKKLGLPDLPAEWLDCSESNVLAAFPSTPGWLLIPDPEIQPIAIADQITAFGTLEFVQRTFEGDPVFSLYRLEKIQ